MDKSIKALYNRIVSSREDVSDYVFHFTRQPDGKNTLKQIIQDKAIKDIHKKGFICFTEAPIAQLVKMFEILKGSSVAHPQYKYAPYGIGIKKSYFYERGGRPVIYASNEEISFVSNLSNLISSESDKVYFEKRFAWRFQPFIPDLYDFTWLREWRIPLAQFDLDYENCFAIVNEFQDQEDVGIWEFNDCDVIDAEPDDGGVTTFFEVKYDRSFRACLFSQMGDLYENGKVIQCDPKKELVERRIFEQSRLEIMHYSSWS